MFRPVGSLPPSVYWRRRVLVGAVSIVALLLVWTLFATAGNGDRPDGHPVAAGKHGAAATPGHTPATITPSPGAGGPPAAPVDGTGGSGASTVPAGGTDSNGTGSNGTNSGGTGSNPGLDAGGGTPSGCAGSALRLTVDTDRTAYQVGDHPVIRLTLTNTSTATCTFDVGAAQQEALVYAGAEPGQDQFWSSNDCDPGGEPDVRALGTNEPLHFQVTWPAVSSRPDCAGTPTPAGAGDYSVVVRVGPLHSTPARITLS